MTKLNTAIFAAVTHSVFSVLIESKSASPLDGEPDGHVYAQIMGIIDLSAYNIIKSIWLDKKWVTIDFHMLRITDAGIAFHKQLDAVYAKHKPLTGDQSSAKLTE